MYGTDRLDEALSSFLLLFFDPSLFSPPLLSPCFFCLACYIFFTHSKDTDPSSILPPPSFHPNLSQTVLITSPIFLIWLPSSPTTEVKRHWHYRTPFRCYAVELQTNRSPLTTAKPSCTVCSCSLATCPTTQRDCPPNHPHQCPSCNLFLTLL